MVQVLGTDVFEEDVGMENDTTTEYVIKHIRSVRQTRLGALCEVILLCENNLGKESINLYRNIYAMQKKTDLRKLRFTVGWQVMRNRTTHSNTDPTRSTMKPGFLTTNDTKETGSLMFKEQLKTGRFIVSPDLFTDVDSMTIDEVRILMREQLEGLRVHTKRSDTTQQVSRKISGKIDSEGKDLPPGRGKGDDWATMAISYLAVCAEIDSGLIRIAAPGVVPSL